MLAQIYGGVWSFGESLDDSHNSEPSPECLVTSNTSNAAIEVKRLTGDSVFQAYMEAQASLERHLVPSCGGFYMLSPAANFWLPIDGVTKRLLKREIERVAPSLEPGDKGVLRIPRKAFVSVAHPEGAGNVWCCHTSSAKFVRDVSARVTGSYLLVDQGMLEHNFVTSEGLEQFQSAVAAACDRCRSGGSGRLEWHEEWELTRARVADDDSDDRDGVWVVCVTEARDVAESVTEAVELILEKALRKFVVRRWADFHALVLEKAEALCNAKRVREALSWISNEELVDLDLILLVDQEGIEVVWCRSDG